MRSKLGFHAAAHTNQTLLDALTCSRSQVQTVLNSLLRLCVRLWAKLALRLNAPGNENYGEQTVCKQGRSAQGGAAQHNRKSLYG